MAWEAAIGLPNGGVWIPVPYAAGTDEPLAADEADGTAVALSFDAALADCTERIQRGMAVGIGCFLGEDDPFVVVEIENVLDTAGGLTKDSMHWGEWVKHLHSYTERTPAGDGLRIFLEGCLPLGGRRRENLCFFEAKRFVPVTGQRWHDAPPYIGGRQNMLEALHREAFPVAGRRPAPAPCRPPASDDDLLVVAFASSNGPRIQALYRGDLTAFPGDRGAADLALCGLLAHFTGDDPARIDRLFRTSRLYRAKWDTARFSDGRSYGEATVAKALEGCLVFHNYGSDSAARGPRFDTDSPALRLITTTAREGATDRSAALCPPPHLTLVPGGALDVA